jgi:hypothetical protein
VTCTDCDLQLHVLAAAAGKMTVALDFAPQAGGVHPRLADVRLRASKAFQVTKVAPGEALGAAGKELFVDPKTGAPFRLRADGSLQLLVHSIATVEDIGAGRLATLELSYSGAEPVSLWLVRREETFAPPPADNALQSAPYDTPVTVSR